MTIEEFIEKCQKRPLPENPMAQIRTMARELAEGVSYGLWNFRMFVEFDNDSGKVSVIDHQRDFSLMVYFLQRWNEHPPNLQLAKHIGYLEAGNEVTLRGQEVFIIQPKCFDLLEETDPDTIFISYGRADSSAFALYILEKLNQFGLDAFLDIQLEVGESWHGELQKQVENVDVLVLLIGSKTLKSEWVQKEIRWAKDNEIYPIWQPSFVKRRKKWEGVPDDIIQILQATQAITISGEEPQHYVTAISQLFNRFGITL